MVSREQDCKCMTSSLAVTYHAAVVLKCNGRSNHIPLSLMMLLYLSSKLR